MKFTIAILVALLLASNAYWLYREIDKGVTQSYRSQELFEGANRQIAATVLASEAVRDKPKREVEVILKRLFPEEQIFEKDGGLHSAWLTLPLTPQGRVSGVATDPLAVAQSAPRSRGFVGNEVFWPKQ